MEREKKVKTIVIQKLSIPKLERLYAHDLLDVATSSSSWHASTRAALEWEVRYSRITLAYRREQDENGGNGSAAAKIPHFTTRKTDDLDKFKLKMIFVLNNWIFDELIFRVLRCRHKFRLPARIMNRTWRGTCEFHPPSPPTQDKLEWNKDFLRTYRK